MHYKRQHKGQPLGPATPQRATPHPPCAVEGCPNLSDTKRWRGLCLKHAARQKKHGNPLVVEGTEQGTVRVETVVFNGVVFRRYPDSRQPSHRRYFKPGGGDIKRGVESLHREVWKAHNGPIPAGYHVHHVNGDPADNATGNLCLRGPDEHAGEHAAGRRVYGRSEVQRDHLARIRDKAAAWHRSPEGRAWHREHARKQWARTRPHAAGD